METFRITAVPGDGSCTLVLSGEADLATADDITQLGTISLSDPATHTLVVDLGGLTFIDSTAINALIKLRNIAKDAAKNLTLVHVSDRVRRVFEIAGLGAVFAIDE